MTEPFKLRGALSLRHESLVGCHSCVSKFMSGVIAIVIFIAIVIVIIVIVIAIIIESLKDWRRYLQS